MIATMLTLSRKDVKALRITDSYSLHRVIYSLFEDVRSEAEKRSSVPSGFLFADKGGDAKGRKILILSDRPPLQPAHGELVSRPVPEEFLQHRFYKFEVTLNPTRKENKSGKRVPIKTREEVAAWFGGKSQTSWGFSVDPARLDVRMLPVMQFSKQGDRTVTHGAARVSGMLRVENRDLFIESFNKGIGRGRAFGFGLLQIEPLKDNSNH
ncbi:MAG TPA: type I-E CRISPR-associated protein Cas6/Cse3/CasE [Chlorobaculum sp.]|uniref:CRISPR-associated protein, CT1974 family n=1 Tax=Chlorobaculum tepidum (strain ATCC 49652 / DSM 12025 / NBRC 103806 / TLS) TaxID=194439 RepID=Q8KB24_CHLTE|nr:type I-E CRISPR-associated protein Cas6/Cse3/CasE [Chlorobaculum tepidum]AAM73192.1 CRISPR-associated protein, CT1974 family [Chlorobaculum tepidum TLS]HBU23306.1 type I-E CRISPR-associated protein Cas6/Cse3/CasE [Chlorobaculum sp.]